MRFLIKSSRLCVLARTVNLLESHDSYLFNYPSHRTVYVVITARVRVYLIIGQRANQFCCPTRSIFNDAHRVSENDADPKPEPDNRSFVSRIANISRMNGEKFGLS